MKRKFTRYPVSASRNEIKYTDISASNKETDSIKNEDSLQEDISVEIDTFINIHRDGNWDYIDSDYNWAKQGDEDGGDTYTSLEYPEIKLADYTDVVEYIDDLLEPLLPMTPGKFHIKGTAKLMFAIDNIGSQSEWHQPDSEDEGDYTTRTYYTDDADVEFIFEDSYIDNFSCEAAK